MSLLTNMILHGIIFAIVITLYLLFTMVKFSPRIWGFSDYPKTITDTVPPQTKAEKKIGIFLSIPFFIMGLAFPIISTIILKVEYGGYIDFLSAFLNIFGIFMFMNFADLIILDWIIVGTITPKFVIIPGTEHMKDKEYKEFRISHGKAHVLGTLFMCLLSLLLAFIIILFN